MRPHSTMSGDLFGPTFTLASLLLAASSVVVVCELNQTEATTRLFPSTPTPTPTVLQARQAPDSSGGTGVSTLAGQIAKTLVYGGASIARLNNWLLCSRPGQASGLTNDHEPTLYVFNDRFRPERAFRIYADDQITADMLAEADFDAAQMTYVFVHGWLGGIGNEHWMALAKDLALGVRDRKRDSTPGFRPNVIVVDWSSSATGSLYQATRHSHQVAKRLGRLLEQLVRVAELRPALIHCIGHSIGLHICGKAARQAFPEPIKPSNAGVGAAGSLGAHSAARPHKMGRITGVDPGGFCYELDISNEPKYLGMRPSDALVTDAYYSNRSPFGNKYQVAQFNVRINNGFFQEPCSVWTNPETAREYLQSTVNFLFATTNHNDVITCDHYFATRFAYERLESPVCSNVGYACHSYRHFVKGRCGLCDSQDQCYSMDFEYQRHRPTLDNALTHLEKHWNYSRNFQAEPEGTSVEPFDGVAYANRPVYYMRMNNDASRCTQTFRVRIVVDRHRMRSIRGDSLRLRLLDSTLSPIELLDSASDTLATEIALHGPWKVHENEADSQLNKFGVDDSTLSALIELPARLEADEFVARLKAAAVFDSDNKLRPDTLLSVRVDYLSSSSRRIRSRLSLTLAGSQIMLVNQRLDDLRLGAG